MFNLVQKVGSSLSPQVNEYIVDTCDRLIKKLHTEGRPRGIVVKFTMRSKSTGKESKEELKYDSALKVKEQPATDWSLILSTDNLSITF